MTLVLNIFNEETAAFLDLKDCSDTAIFVKAATTLWNCINVKSKDPWFKLNDENRKTFEWVDDQRLESILLLPEKFEDIDTSNGHKQCFTLVFKW